ncbi:hypothetical protein BH10PLA2_BH10PLA2_39870 [soil metagenome]
MLKLLFAWFLVHPGQHQARYAILTLLLLEAFEFAKTGLQDFCAGDEVSEALTQVRALVGNDQTRSARTLHRLFQFGLHQGGVGFLHRHQSHELQVGQLQSTLTRRNSIHRTTEDHQDFLRADLDSVINQPYPRCAPVERSGQSVIPDA